MSITVFRQFLREALFSLGKRVEILESTGGRLNWKVVKSASPGNLQDVEEELGGQVDAAPMILSVRISPKAAGSRAVGVCFADASTRELGVSEFLDNDLYSNFEALLIQLGVKECLMQVDKSENKDPDLAKLRHIIDNCGIAISERPSGDFGTKDIQQDLERLLKDEKALSRLPQEELSLAMGSAAALVKYLGILQDTSNHGQYRLFQHDLGQFMKLDAAALKALHLMPGARDGASSMSLYGMLNHCKTPVGSRLLAQWLKQPLMSKVEIEKRQQLVEAFISDTELRQTMQEEHLRSIPDLYRLSKRFLRDKATLEDVVRAYQVTIRLPGILGTLEGVMDEKYRDPLDEAYTSKLTEVSASLRRMQEMVETTMDLDAIDGHEYIIKADFDVHLQASRKKLDKIRQDMEREYTQAARDLGQEKDKKIFLENHRMHGWCMRLTRQEAGCIRNNGKYQECSTQKNGVYFTTKNLQTLRRQFDQLSQNYSQQQSTLAAQVIDVAKGYCPVLERLAAVLAHMDVIVAFAHCAVHAPTGYVRPKMHTRGEGQTLLRESRHPCLEMQDDIHFITNDVTLTRDKSSFLIITGPNMGGKSTYIRQIGVIALMAQIGSFVPCSEAELTIFDAILARVGASDSSLKGVSTFMAEMYETANILKSATKESLIIIDELGRGTSTYDGFGLAWAISEHIIKEIGCFALFATHFHELTALEDLYPEVENLHVTAHITGLGNDAAADDGDGKREVTLLYKVEPGICDQSFGIHVAELVRFPDKVVRMAKRKADELESFGTKHEVGVGSGDISPAEVEAGSQMLKDRLLQWRDKVKDGNMSKEEMVAEMRTMLLGDPDLASNRFFQSVLTL